MPIVVNLDVMLARRKMRSRELSEIIGITEQNVSLLKSGKVRGIRFDTLESICRALTCQPGDLLEFVPDGAVNNGTERAELPRHAGGSASRG
jgi:putative transcriptional regulator